MMGSILRNSASRPAGGAMTWLVGRSSTGGSRPLVATLLPAQRLFSSTADVEVLPNWIGGKEAVSTSTERIEVRNPATNAVLRFVPDSSEEDLKAAVDAAAAAFPAWRDTSVSRRCRVMLEYQRLLRENEAEIVDAMVAENGKTVADAKGDLFRGLEVVESCCALAPSLMGETLPNVARGMDVSSVRSPLGVCAGVAPFNFPAMIPLWMFPVAVTSGNTFLLKPSEKVPLTSMILARLAQEAGLPPGVLNVVHGAKRAVNFLCDDPAIKAVSFVGGNAAGEHIFARATGNGKRVQANLGAKNHAVIMPDCDKNTAIDALVGASMGAAGQRCMALSVAVLVGDAQGWVAEIAKRASLLKVGDGADPTTDVGPLISRESLKRASETVTTAVEQGATLALDGRDNMLTDGNFMGPTVLADVQTDNVAYTREIFAPVLCCVHVATLDDAIAVVNANPYGNGGSVFTASGSAARQFASEVQVGMVGVNVAIPVPLPMFSFTGARGSFRGDLAFYGKQGVHFFTQCKTVTSFWPPPDSSSKPSSKSSTTMPTHR